MAIRRAWIGAGVVAAGAAAAAGAPGGGEAGVPGAVDGARMMAFIRALPEARAASTAGANAAGLREAEAQAERALRDAGYEVRSDPIPVPEGGSVPACRNLVAELPGRGLEREVVLVGAHLDAVPGSPGADDNGSGVAGCLELARVLRATTPRRTVRFVIFNAEEVGLLGSSHMAGAVTDEAEGGGPRVVAMLSLEMLGYYCDEPGCQVNPFAAVPGFKVPDRGTFIGLGTVLQHRAVVRTLARGMAKAEQPMPTVVFDLLPIAPPDLLRSDHAPFLLRGVPAVIVTDTANFRNPHYHRATDRHETLDAERLAACVRSLAHGVLELAEADFEPAAAPVPGSGAAGSDGAPAR